MLVPGAQPGNVKADLAELEAKMAKDANSVLDGVLDLNVTMTDLGGRWDGLMMLRSRILELYGVPADKAKPPGSRFPPTPPDGASMLMAWQAAQGANGGFEGDFKSKLQTEVCRRSKKSLTKDELVYTVVQHESGKGFIASVHGATEGLLQRQYRGTEPSSGKRAAEHAAAKAALLAEFAQGMGMSGLAPTVKKKPLSAAGGAPANGGPGHDPKTRLMKASQLLLGRPVTKGEVVYATSPVEATGGKTQVSVVSIPAHDPSASWQGAPADTLKQAEFNAAEVAFAAVAHKLGPLEEQRKEKKARQAKEQYQKKKAQKEATGLGGPGVGAGAFVS